MIETAIAILRDLMVSSAVGVQFLPLGVLPPNMYPNATHFNGSMTHVTYC